jgi:proline iminopeptidase
MVPVTVIGQGETMARITANGIEIAFEAAGPETAPVVLLTRGLGTQMIEWPIALWQGLVEHGFRVVRYDNRDAGLSQKLGPCEAPPGIEGAVDMADDAIGLLDGLGIERAHILGISMGGMISQIVAARFPERTASLISIMSTAGEPNPLSGPQAALEALREPWPPATDREAIIARWIRDDRLFGSRSHPSDADSQRERATAWMERCYCPGGMLRQRAAINAAGSRAAMLRRISRPTLVIHGNEDPLIPPAVGARAARLIPDATFKLVKGMGHDLPAPLIPELLDAIVDFCRPPQRPVR